MAERLEMVTVDPARGFIGLDREVAGGKPAYCLHGVTFCALCEKAVWLGSESAKAVLSGMVPVCMNCIADMEKSGALSAENLIGHLDDHMRADGPHDS